ncbi:MAG TPA: DUF3500 domain-containing protein [Verrucomicrobiae bacterium]|nr:DUF3500 domain-containing protein [Verrucomicrobiae bacterium]
MIPSSVACRILLCAVLTGTSAQADAAAPQEMAGAAVRFLDALSPEQRDKACFDFKGEERFNWDFVPRGRKGIPFREMNTQQQQLGRALLRSGLSQQGYTKATNIITVIEQVLREMENQSARRDPGLYCVTVFGSPTNAAWGWRVEGHHLSLNFTVASNQVLAFSPSFFGSNPAEVPHGPHKGFRTFAAEEDLGRELAMSFTPDQRKRAVISATAPREILTGSSRKASPLEPLGIAHAELTSEQRQLLEKLLREYVYRFKEEIADKEWARIRAADLSKLHFAWAGPFEKGQGHYYRIQGTDFLVEYDNTQNQANHIHTVWRDFDNDFGLDLLRQHYEHGGHSH